MGGWPHYTDSLVDSLIVSIYSVDADADDLDTETLNLVGSLTTVFTRDSGASCASATRRLNIYRLTGVVPRLCPLRYKSREIYDPWSVVRKRHCVGGVVPCSGGGR